MERKALKSPGSNIRLSRLTKRIDKGEFVHTHNWEFAGPRKRLVAHSTEDNSHTYHGFGPKCFYARTPPLQDEEYP